MRKHLTAQQGFTLIELLVGMTLVTLLLAGMLSVFSTSLNTWRLEKDSTRLQQTARIGIDAIVREIRYAHEVNIINTSTLTITKAAGETKTFHLGEGLHKNTLYVVIDKTHAVPVGGISNNPITENIVTKLEFTPYWQGNNIRAVGITLEVANKTTGKKQILYSAGYPLNAQ